MVIAFPFVPLIKCNKSFEFLQQSPPRSPSTILLGIEGGIYQ